MLFDYFLLLVIIGCYLLSGLRLHSEAGEKEISEMEIPKNAEWSFPKKDFIPANKNRTKSLTSAEKTENGDKNFDTDGSLEVATRNEKNDFPPSGFSVPQSSTDTTKIADAIPSKNGESQRPPSEEIAEMIDSPKKNQLPLAAQSGPEKNFLPENVPSIESHHLEQDAMATKIRDIPTENDQLDNDTEILSETTPVRLSEKRINILLLKARSFLLVNSLDDAHQIVKIILKSEPSHGEALAIEHYIKQCALETDGKFPRNVNETREQMMENVKDTWELPKIFTESICTEHDSEDWNNMFKRLNRIVIPKISFNNTPFTQAINTIIALSEQYDTEKDPQKSGINMVVMLANTGTEPTLSLSLKNMPLDKILNFIAKSTAYQFDIEDEVIVFRKAEGNLSENLISEFFKISRSAVIRMTGIQSTNSNSNSGDKDAKKTDSSKSNGSLAEEERLIKEFLQKAGVNFSNISGSNLAFDGSQLIVTQSLRNIKRVREILIRYEQVKQVEIETKFIEVQQGKLDELQFGWNSAFKHLGTGTDAAVQPRSFTLGTTGAGSDKSNINNLRSVHDAFTIRNESGGKGTIAFTNSTGKESTIEIPSSTPNAPGGLNLGVSATILSNLTGVISDKIGLSLTIRALEQQSGSDLMSAPKLTVLSGKTAKITVAQEFIYPKTYGEISSEVGTGDANSAGVTITAGTPSDFETRNVGVEMNVTPTVEENNCISLQLSPKVTEFEGFIEYGGRSIAISGNTRADLPPGFYQPIFSTREIQTEVTIYDGATVVMGGLTREEIKEVNDKVPLLGDIPLIGRLFRSKGETNQKKNLLIFVTANILSPGGTPVRMQNKMPKKDLVYRSNKESQWNVSSEIEN
ncbi:MAG: type II and III secretion system protein [Puniceicoccales bacterium]|jgi:general secretion pathway protein D|nr:type II and III secretion system protein [Puniceicoccales bacterium]